MHWVKAAEYPADIDFSKIDAQLHNDRIPHRFTMESAMQILWLPQTENAEQVITQIQEWLRYPEKLNGRASKTRRSRIQLDTKPAPFTLFLLFLSFTGSALPFLGDQFIQPFTFWDTTDRLVYGESVFRDVLSGDYWRIISPIFLHFGPTHIIFNAMFLWYLGSMIETHSGFLSLQLISGG